jgi:hypothetical protein
MSRQNVRFFDGAESPPGPKFVKFYIETRAAPGNLKSL